MWYTAVVEAKGWGSPEAEGASLEDALPGGDEDLRLSIWTDDEQGLVRLQLVFDAQDGLDAHEQALTIWHEAWEQAFGEVWPMVLNVRATPGLPDELPVMAAVGAASNADPLADLDDDGED